MKTKKRDAIQEYIKFQSALPPKFVYALGDIVLIGYKNSGECCQKLKTSNDALECEDLQKSGECDGSCRKISDDDRKQIEQALPTLLKDLEAEETPPAIRFDPIATQQANKHLESLYRFEVQERESRKRWREEDKKNAREQELIPTK